ncbi:Sec1-like protein [Cynara cardunculus var. scolymus]|uniref:Sec1-like protein n=1 Tax=Cynara cardunculus var. scolymus TaxID=59895 RepID=A0A124SBA9_CYNCS|nr:Sec1-like protein [Cynara cardunculus var. scolymus]
MSDWDTSFQGGNDHKNFRQISRDRLLYEMIRSAKRQDAKSNWKVLIMDKVTVRIMSHSCKMADITDEGVSLVEDINKRRQPLPTMDAVYYIQPTKENVVMLLSDMAGKTPLYRDAYVYFSSSVPKELIADIKKEPTIKSRLRAMKEMNLEFFAIDSQCFITDHGRALEEFYGDEEISRKGDECLTAMANRIATVFASMLVPYKLLFLQEFPFVRYRAAKSLDPTTMTTFCDLIPTKLAAAVWNALMKYKSLNNFPQIETCELLILDRSIDQIAPIIHEWTYDAMCHDLLDMEGNKYVYEVPSKTGDFEKKEVLLEEHDPIWLELRHSHIADASERLHDKMTNFVAKNKAAMMHQGSRDGAELSTRDLQKMVQALPQYSEQMEKLSLHVDIAGKINSIIRETRLKDVGQLEQDLVFGDAGTKEVIEFLRTQPDVEYEYKLRLLMIYAATHPEKFESDKLTEILELADLSPDDKNAVYNMRFLEGATDTTQSSNNAFSLKFDARKKKRGLRKDRPGEEAVWQLSRFYPMIEVLIEKLSKNDLPVNEYPCMNDPSPTFHGASHSVSARVLDTPSAHSMRSRRATWARRRTSDDGYSSESVLRRTTSEFQRMGKRIFVFIIGGATRSELRACHKLTTKLRREIILGSSSLDSPAQFIEKLKSLTPKEEISLDDLEI